MRQGSCEGNLDTEAFVYIEMKLRIRKERLESNKNWYWFRNSWSS